MKKYSARVKYRRDTGIFTSSSFHSNIISAYYELLITNSITNSLNNLYLLLILIVLIIQSKTYHYAIKLLKNYSLNLSKAQ